MQEFRSADWYRVAAVRPKLADHIQARRQTFRAQVWYVLFDSLTQRTHRLTPQAWHVVARMDGKHTVEDLWQASLSALGEDAAPQSELVGLLAQLHAADALVSDTMPDLDELIRRRDKHRAQLWKRNLTNPLSIRVRLFDPDELLNCSQSLWRWVFTPVGLVMWLMVMLPAGIATLMYWTDLVNNPADQLLSASSLLTMLLVYPVVKLLHEFAHACAAKAFGAEVHDMGLMFLVFMPLPYVDASGSAVFASKWQRAVVAAAGMMMELLLGALAIGLWLLVEPGVTRSVLFSVMVIGGVSTLLFTAIRCCGSMATTSCAMSSRFPTSRSAAPTTGNGLFGTMSLASRAQPLRTQHRVNCAGFWPMRRCPWLTGLPSPSASRSTSDKTLR